MENIWTGRNDGTDPDSLRIFQKIKNSNNYEDLPEGSFFIHGFASDEGVRRNKGRTGAAAAPNLIRKGMSNFPVLKPEINLVDFGNIVCENGDLELAQNQLSSGVARGLQKGGKSIVLGGGHALLFGHYRGIQEAYRGQKVGIINFDAHFDNRMPPEGKGNSGTGFWQIGQLGTLHSLHIGIQRNSNTQTLFKTANALGMQYILADELFESNLSALSKRIRTFTESVDVVYTTICMDGFNTAIAPGVSAQAYNGIFPDHVFLTLLRQILAQPNTVAMDVAEVNPTYDIQDRTSRLAAALINEWLMV